MKNGICLVGKTIATAEVYQKNLNITFTDGSTLKIEAEWGAAIETKFAAPPMEPIPSYGDHMTLDEFIDGVKCHAFMDDDGSGQYASATQMSPESVCPSNIDKGKINRAWTHVVWFNK